MTMFSLPSTLTHDQASASLQQLQAMVDKLPAGSSAVVDAAGLTVFDSSVLAVLLEARRKALAAGKALHVQNAPAAVASLARLYGVDALLQLQDTPAPAVNP